MCVYVWWSSGAGEGYIVCKKHVSAWSWFWWWKRNLTGYPCGDTRRIWKRPPRSLRRFNVVPIWYGWSRMDTVSNTYINKFNQLSIEIPRNILEKKITQQNVCLQCTVGFHPVLSFFRIKLFFSDNGCLSFFFYLVEALHPSSTNIPNLLWY